MFSFLLWLWRILSITSFSYGSPLWKSMRTNWTKPESEIRRVYDQTNQMKHFLYLSSKDSRLCLSHFLQEERQRLCCYMLREICNMSYISLAIISLRGVCIVFSLDSRVHTYMYPRNLVILQFVGASFTELLNRFKF